MNGIAEVLRAALKQHSRLLTKRELAEAISVLREFVKPSEKLRRCDPEQPGSARGRRLLARSVLLRSSRRSGRRRRVHPALPAASPGSAPLRQSAADRATRSNPSQWPWRSPATARSHDRISTAATAMAPGYGRGPCRLRDRRIQAAPVLTDACRSAAARPRRPSSQAG